MTPRPGGPGPPALRIALTVNHPHRDLAGVVLTAMALCRKGATCFITPANFQEWEIWSLAPDFVVLHYARRGIDAFVERLARAGIGFGVLDAEGGIWESCDVYSELLWPDRSLLARARPYCSWGPALADHLVRDRFLSQEQIRVTGCPRFDFYHPSWRSVLLDEGAGDRRRRILVNTNFSMVNPRFVSPDRNRENMQSVYGWDEARVRQLLDKEQQAIAATIAMVSALAADVPDCRIVVRPHPFESPEPYRRALHHANVEVNADGPVQTQIARAAVVVQRSCTTAVESGFAAVPTLSPQWIDPPFLMPMSEQVSVPCADYRELRDHISAILAGSFRLPETIRAAVERVTRDWFHAIDGQAHERAAEAILSWALPSTIDRRLCSRYLYGLNNGTTSSPQDVGRWARLRLGLNPDWSFRHMRRVRRTSWDRTDKAFTQLDVSRLVERIEHAAPGAFPPLAVHRARDVGECGHDYDGRSVRVSCVN